MNNNLSKIEKILKSCFKEKIRVTTGTMVAFLITGAVGYGEDFIIPANPDTVDYLITEGNFYGNYEKYGTNEVSKTIVIDGTDVTTPGSTSQGISANGNTMKNIGSIWVRNGYAEGMGTYGAGESNIINEGNIYVSGGLITRVKGMGVNPGGKAVNKGKIIVNGGSAMIDNSGNDNKSLINDIDGQIFVGDNSIGIYYRKEKINANNSVENRGSIIVNGTNAIGVKLGIDKEDSSYYNKNFTNSGTIIASGIQNKAIEGDESDNILYLRQGSHIQGLVDLGAGSDTINIDGIGNTDNIENLTLKNIEKMTIKNSNILLAEGTELKLKNNTNIESSTLRNKGNISAAQDTQNLYVLNAQSGDNNIINEREGIITSVRGGSAIVIGGINSKVINKGTINATGDIADIPGQEWVSKGINIINGAEALNEGTINVLDGTTAGSALYIYSGRAINSLSGTINLSGREARGIRAYGGVINGANTNETRDLYALNEGKILGENDYLYGMYLTKIGDKDAILKNSGLIQLVGNNNTGISIVGSSEKMATGINIGTISITGTDSLGMYVKDNNQIINNGTIALNVFKSDADKTYSGNIAMKGDGDNATIESKGTIQLTDIYKTELTGADDAQILLDFVNSTLIAGKDKTGAVAEHKGIVTDADGKVIAAAGEEISGVVGNIDEEDILKANGTITVTGTDLNGTLNSGESFDSTIKSDYLVHVSNSTDTPLNIAGTLNTGAGVNGVKIEEGSKVYLTGNINAIGDIALYLENNAALNATGAVINGNIIADGATEITLAGTKVDGNISLGTGTDTLTMDKVTVEYFGSDSIIDGGEGYDTLNIGTAGEVTVVKGTLKNFEDKNINGIVMLNADSNIKLDSELAARMNIGGPDIKIAEDSILVLGIKEENGGYNHALTDVGGDISGDGTLYADTRNLNIGTEGITVDLKGTIVNLEADQIKATQFIYNVSLGNPLTKFGGTVLDINLNRDVKDMGIDGKYQDVWNSIVIAGQADAAVYTTTSGTASDLEELMYQTKERNIYSLGTKLAHNSMKLYEMGTENFTVSPESGKWLTQAKGIGSYENGEHSAEFNTTGVLVAGEYGISSNTSMGLSFGAGKQEARFDDYSSKLEADTFYVGAYGKHKMDNFKFLAGAGYQFNSVDARNITSNNFDRFDNSSDFDSRGFNVFGKAAYTYDLGSEVRLEPNVGVAFNYLKQYSADEGNKDWAISVDSLTSKTTDLKVGIDLVKEFASDTQKGSAYLSLGHKFTLGDRDKELTAKFNGAETADYTVVGFELDKNMTSVGAGVDIENENGFFYGATYAYEFNSKSKNHKVGLGLGYKF